jgi:uncharacterized membrane protein
VSLVGPLLTVGIGIGMGLGACIIDAEAMNQIDTDHSGMASGMLNTVRGGANALILAIFGAVLITLLTATLGSAELAGRVATGNIPANSVELETHLTDAWRTSLLGLAALCALAAGAAGVLVRAPHTRANPPG